MEEQLRDGFVAAGMRDWKALIERIERGYDGSPADYTLAITTRAQLEASLFRGPPPRRDLRDELSALDERFFALTEPVAADAAIIPTPSAGRWWRRPKSAAPSLDAAFGPRRPGG